MSLRQIGLMLTATLVTALASTVSIAEVPPPSPVLRGFVDLHTHPMSNLAFGGKLIHGGVDVGSLLPVDSQGHKRVRATSITQALGDDRGTHGGWGLDNQCGDAIRKQVIHQLQAANQAAVTPDRARGAGDFRDWPRWDDITHQKMWVDWIRRAHDGGLRVMVALATNNRTLGDAVSGPGDGPTDNKASADLQVTETKAFVARHSDFMAVAYTPEDLRRTVAAGKLAVVLGVEIDDIGNFNRESQLTPAKIDAEIDRLYTEGVRYIFPIHVIDNPFGGTAAYEDFFNLANFRETGHFWDLEAADPATGIGYRYTPNRPELALGVIKVLKLGTDPFREPPAYPTDPGIGHQNRLGLTPLGEMALKAMMRRGMLVDIDHMSERAANRALAIAEAVPEGGYPLNSGHSDLRGEHGSERNRSPLQLQRIAKLHGIVGVGCAATDAYTWLQHYAKVLEVMGNGGAGLGTDLNGLTKAPKPRPGSNLIYDASFPKSQAGTKVWDYNVDGVAHYGMLADWVRDMRSAPQGHWLVDEHLMHSADFFWRTWQRAEAQRGRITD